MTERTRNEKLTAARIAAGYSQERLAEAVEVNPKTVGRWETDSVIPHADIRKKVGETLGRNPDELFAQRPERPLQPKKEKKSDSSPTFSPHSPPGMQYVVNMTYEQARSHGIISSENSVPSSHERGEQTEGMDKREFLVQGKNIIAASVATSIIGDVPHSTVMIPAEEFLPQCAISLTSCWRFLNLGSLDMTEQILAVNIPTLLTITITPSKHQQTAATFMTQAKIIQSIIAGHQLKYPQKEMYCQEALKWSQFSGNNAIMAAALLYLSTSYIYFSPIPKPQEAIEKLNQALYILGNTPTLLKSVIYATLADAYAQLAREQETLRSIALATENFPDHPERDPYVLLADCSKGSLLDRQGRALNKLAARLKSKEQYTQANLMLDESLTPDRVPRGRICALKGKTQAALGLRNLDTYTAYAQETVHLAASIESKWNYSQVQDIHAHIPTRWRHEQAIIDLEGVFASVRTSLFSSQIV